MNNVCAYDDEELFDFDNEFDPMSTLDEDIQQLTEFEVNKKNSDQCKVKLDTYPVFDKRCVKKHCLALCKNRGSIDGKCRKSNTDKIKVCYCYKNCDTTTTSSSPSIAPALSPSPIVAPVYPPVASPTPVASPAYSTSEPALEPAASTLDEPCDDSEDDVPSPPRKTVNSVEEFSDEDFDLIFS